MNISIAPSRPLDLHRLDQFLHLQWIDMSQPCADREPRLTVLTRFTANACHVLSSVFKSVFRAPMSLWTLLWRLWLPLQAVLFIRVNHGKTGYQGCGLACYFWHTETIYLETIPKSHTQICLCPLCCIYSSFCAPQLTYFAALSFEKFFGFIHCYSKAPSQPCT